MNIIIYSQAPSGGVYLADRCPDTKGGRQLPRHRYHSIPVEEGDGDSEPFPNDGDPMTV